MKDLFKVKESDLKINYTFEDVLKFIPQEDIYKNVLGYYPVEYERIVSPLREDKEPGCWFEYNEGILYFVDFASDMKSMDCFEFTKRYFNLSSIKETLNYIVKNFKKGNKTFEIPIIKKKRAVITYETRPFVVDDMNYWKPYGISSDNLEEDKVYALKSYTSTRYKSYYQECRFIKAYADTNFDSGHIKIYMPGMKPKFISNCTHNDVGCINSTNPSRDKAIVISKSYKDCRIIRNLGFDSIYLLNENTIPDERSFIDFLNQYKRVIVFYDNDMTGIIGSDRVCKELRELGVFNVSNCYLPVSLSKHQVKDSADFYKKYGKELLIQTLEKMKFYE